MRGRFMILCVLGLWLAGWPAPAAPRYDLATQQLRNRARTIVIAAVRQTDSFVRSLAIRALADLDDRASFPLLRLALLSPDRSIRYLAFRALYRLGDPAATTALALGLRSRKPAERIQAVWMIGEMADLFRRQGDRRALDWLLAAARDKDGDVRMTALEALGKLGDPGGTEAAMIGCRDSVDEARQYAVETLGRIGQPEHIPLVLRLLEDKDAGVRRQATLTLARLGLKGGEPERSSVAAGLRRALADPDSLVRVQAAVGLLQLDAPDAGKALQALLAEKDTAVRLAAIEALGPLASRAAVPVWRLALQDQEEEVRFRSAQLLAGRGDRAGEAVLRAVLKNKDWSLRLQAAEALADLGSATALLQALQDPSYEIHLAALNVLTRRPGLARADREEILDLLLQRLDDPHPPIRARAAEAIGLLQDRTSLPRMKALLDDQHENVRTSAAWAVLRLTK